MTMQTGAFWNVDKPDKPWGPFDPQAKLLFPLSWTDWLADAGTTIKTAQILDDGIFELAKPVTEIAGVVFASLKLKAGVVYEPGTKYPFTCRVTTMDDQQDDRTFWLKVGDR